MRAYVTKLHIPGNAALLPDIQIMSKFSTPSSLTVYKTDSPCRERERERGGGVLHSAVVL